MSTFLDANLRVYAVSSDARGPVARERIRGGGLVSVQVLNEFVNVALKKLRGGWPEIEQALRYFLEAFEAVVPINLATHRAAIVIARDHKAPFYDALIVASALESRCEELVTEDKQDGRVFGGLTIRNPFRRNV